MAKVHRLEFVHRDRGYRWQDRDPAMEELCALIHQSEMSVNDICKEVSRATGGAYAVAHGTIDNWLSGKTRRPSNYTLTWVGLPWATSANGAGPGEARVPLSALRHGQPQSARCRGALLQQVPRFRRRRDCAARAKQSRGAGGVYSADGLLFRREVRMGEAKRRSQARAEWEEARRQGRSLGDGPVEEQYHAQMTAIMQTLDEFLNGPKGPGYVKRNGIVIMMFPFENFDGRCNYMSNGASREDIVTLMKEMIARFEGQPEVGGTA